MSSVDVYKRALLAASKFDNYNFRLYFVRRVKEVGAAHEGASAEELQKAFADADLDLGVLERQAAISQMYQYDKNVVERSD